MDSLTDLLQRFEQVGIEDLDDVGTKAVVAILLLSLLSSLFLFVAYRLGFERRATGSDVHRSFLLIGPATTAIFLCLQFSLPLSLGLLGSLSIVRFRTPIKEPEEIGFLLVLIASSLCCATLNLRFLAALLGIALLGILVLHALGRWGKPPITQSSLLLDLPGESLSTLDEVRRILQAAGWRMQVQSVESAGGRTRCCLSLEGSDPDTLVRTQRKISEALPDAEVTVYLSAAA